MAVNKVVYGGKTLIDLSSDTVTADDIVSDRKAHNASGEQITGTISIRHGGYQKTVEPDDLSYMQHIGMTVEVDTPTLVSPSYGGIIRLMSPYSSFGDATAEDVVSGKTFTSAAGLKVRGTGLTYSQGFQEGYQEGYDEGCADGYQDGWDLSNEVMHDEVAPVLIQAFCTPQNLALWNKEIGYLCSDFSTALDEYNAWYEKNYCEEDFYDYSMTSSSGSAIIMLRNYSEIYTVKIFGYVTCKYHDQDSEMVTDYTYFTKTVETDGEVEFEVQHDLSLQEDALESPEWEITIHALRWYL